MIKNFVQNKKEEESELFRNLRKGEEVTLVNAVSLCSVYRALFPMYIQPPVRRPLSCLVLASDREEY